MINGEVTRNLLLMIFGLVLIGVAIGVLTASKKGRLADLANTSIHVIVACVFAGMGASAIAWAVFGKRILDTFGISIG